MPSVTATDVIVIGAGPAGWMAAREAAAAGLSVMVVDENVLPGGQITRRRLPSRAERQAATPVADDLPARATFLGETTCIGFGTDAKDVILSNADGIGVVRTRAVVLATGALERSRPVPGWTLPGVMTAGAAQTMLKGSGRFPFRRVVVAGSGPLLLAATSQLLRAGIEVAALVEAQRPQLQYVRHLPSLLGATSVFRDGVGYIATIARHRVPVFLGWGVKRVRGSEAVEEVDLQPLTQDWMPLDRARSTRTIVCDSVLMSFGFTSNTGLASLLGVRLEQDADRRSWRPARDASFRTSNLSVWAVGDCAGVEGAAVSELEGALAGLSVAEQLTGKAAPPERRERLRNQLKRHVRFEAALNRVWAPRGRATAWAEAETPVCRCEGTTLAQLEVAVADGASSLQTLKLRTRAGMGSCQGRTCTPLLRDFLARGDGSGADVAPPSVRFPARPVPAGALASWSTDAEEASVASPAEGD